MLKNIAKLVVARYARNSILTTTKIGVGMRILGAILSEAGEATIASVETTIDLLEKEELNQKLYDKIQESKVLIEESVGGIRFIVGELRPMMIKSVIDARQTLKENDDIRAAHLRWFTEGSIEIIRVMPKWIATSVQMQMEQIMTESASEPAIKIVDATKMGNVLQSLEAQLQAQGIRVIKPPME